VALLGSVFALLGRFAGRLLNAALGWATLLLFGRVEERKQFLLLLIALGSIAWVVVVAGVVLPDVGTFLLAFVPVPAFVDDAWVRLAMLAGAVAIPLLVGIAAVFVTDEAARPRGLGLVRAVLRGYPFTFVLAATIAVLGGVAIVSKVRTLSKRWEDAHVPVITKPGRYDEVLADVRDVVRAADLAVETRPAPVVLSVPPRLLDLVAGRTLGSLVPDRLMLLGARDLEILVYPSDLRISGSRASVARARAAIASKLVEAPAYLTSSRESEAIEDELEALARAARGPNAGDADFRDRLDGIDARLATLTVSFDEWETLYRQRLQVERDALRREMDGAAPGHLGSADAAARKEGGAGALGRGVGLAGIALLALDVMLLLADRLAPPSGRSRR
jgi:hypothetical protein